MELDDIMHLMMIATLNNLMQLSTHRELTSYEQQCYNQLLMTLKVRSRLDELIIQQSIKDIQDGKRVDQTSGGGASQNFEVEEY